MTFIVFLTTLGLNMRKEDLFGTWEYSAVFSRGGTAGLYTFEDSGRFTAVPHIDGFFLSLSGFILGDIWEGRWKLDENGTRLKMQYRSTNSKIFYVFLLAVILQRFFVPLWGDIEKAEQDCIELTYGGRKTILKRVRPLERI